jgi:hypothetical protein
VEFPTGAIRLHGAEYERTRKHKRLGAESDRAEAFDNKIEKLKVEAN